MDKRHSKPPCEHMKSALNDSADGTAGILKRLFTASHCLHCGPCRRYREALRAIVQRLRREGEHEADTQVLSRLERSVEAATAQLTQLP
jgi:NADH:ubiquinone oxidoreductase subunit F (NADH-binding)